MPSPYVTDRQRRILTVVTDHVKEHGYPPSYREIASAVDLVSPSSVAHQLRELVSKGLLSRDPARPRALRIVEVDPRPYKVMFLDRPGLVAEAAHLGDVVWILRLAYPSDSGDPQDMDLWQSDEDTNLWTSTDGRVSVTYAPDRRSA